MALVRWCHLSINEIDDMLLSDAEMLNRSFVQYPPVDLLVASYLGYKSPDSAVTKMDAKRANSTALKTIPFTSGKMKTIDQMPEYLRSPEKMALIERMKAG